MTNKAGIAVAFIAALLCLTSVASAVNTEEIDAVRRKVLLNGNDQLIIDNFVRLGIYEMLNTENIHDIASARITLTSRSKSQQESAQIQYGPYFFSAVDKHLKSALHEAEQIPESKQKTIVTMNMMILVNDLANIELSKLALQKADDENITIRYWAVQAITNPNIIKQLNSTAPGRAALAEQYIDKLKTVAKEETVPDIIAMITPFAATVQNPDATELLIQIADIRIMAYANWTVKNEILDATVLKALFDRIQIDRITKAALARRFAQLYSYVIQRHLLAYASLTEEQRRALASVVVSAEKPLLGKLISSSLGNLKRSIEKDKFAVLAEEHDILFGSDSAQGKLPLALNFNYGKNTDGSIRTAPLKLKKQTE